MRKFLPATVVAISFASVAHAAPVTHFLDVFVTSNFNTTTGMNDALYVDPLTQAGTLSLSYDTGDALPNGTGSSTVFLDPFTAAFNFFPSSFDLTLSLGGVSQTWSQPEFLAAEATVDLATGTELESLDFVLLTIGGSASVANPNIIDITPELGTDFLRFDATGAVTGIELEIQTAPAPAPIPLPASLPLLAGGMLLLGAARTKSKKNS